MISAETIKNLVHMDTVLEWYGLELNRSRFMLCPFHGDTDASLKIYEGDRGWHCFGCQRGGSVIDFVMLMDNLAFSDACQTIARQAGLQGLDNRVPERIQTQIYSRKFKENKKRKQRQEVDYWMHKVKGYEEIVETATEITPDLVEACQNLAYAEYRLEVAIENEER